MLWAKVLPGELAIQCLLVAWEGFGNKWQGFLCLSLLMLFIEGHQSMVSYLIFFT